MSAKPDIVVIGAGAIGLPLAATALLDGRTVALVGRDAIIERIRRSGFSIQMKCPAGGTVWRKFDSGASLRLFSDRNWTGLSVARDGLVIIATKTPDLAEVVRTYLGALAAGDACPTILMIQNGLCPEERFRELLREYQLPAAAQNIVGCVVVGSSTLEEGDAEIRVPAQLTHLHYGAWTDVAARGSQLRKVVNDLFFAADEFTVAGSVSAYRSFRYSKAAMNLSNALSALFLAPVGSLVENPFLAAALAHRIDEAVAIACANGIALDARALRARFGDLARGPLLRVHLASMGQDVRRALASQSPRLATEVEDLDFAFLRALELNGSTDLAAPHIRFYGEVLREVVECFNRLVSKGVLHARQYLASVIDGNRAHVGMSPIHDGGESSQTALRFYEHELLPQRVYDSLLGARALAVSFGVDCATAGAPPAAPIQSYSVLFMDDHPGTAHETAEMFRRAVIREPSYRKATHVECLVSTSGAEALEMIEARRGEVDLVVADVVMPDIDGPAVLRRLAERFPDVGAIVLSAYGTPEQKSRIRRTSAFEWLDKPIDELQLFDAVAWSLHRNAGRKRFSLS